MQPHKGVSHHRLRTNGLGASKYWNWPGGLEVGNRKMRGRRYPDSRKPGTVLGNSKLSWAVWKVHSCSQFTASTHFNCLWIECLFFASSGSRFLSERDPFSFPEKRLPAIERERRHLGTIFRGWSTSAFVWVHFGGWCLWEWWCQASNFVDLAVQFSKLI